MASAADRSAIVSALSRAELSWRPPGRGTALDSLLCLFTLFTRFSSLCSFAFAGFSFRFSPFVSLCMLLLFTYMFSSRLSLRLFSPLSPRALPLLPCLRSSSPPPPSFCDTRVYHSCRRQRWPHKRISGQQREQKTERFLSLPSPLTFSSAPFSPFRSLSSTVAELFLMLLFQPNYKKVHRCGPKYNNDGSAVVAKVGAFLPPFPLPPALLSSGPLLQAAP